MSARDHIIKATRDLSPEAAEVISESVYRITIDIEAAERALAAAEEADELIESTNASLKLISAIRANVNREWSRFHEALAIAVKVAARLECQSAKSIEEPKKPSLDNYQSIESVPPHAYGLRDVVSVTLEMQVIGKITARGPIIAVCELLDGYWVYSRYGKCDYYNHNIMRRGMQILATVSTEDKLEFICPDMVNQIGGHLTNNITNIVGKVNSGISEYSSNVGYYGGASKQTQHFTCGFISYMSLQKGNAVLGLPDHMSELYREPRSDYHYQSGLNKRGDICDKYLRINPLPPPKVRVLRYEQSYRVLVAAPWDFELDTLRARAAAGEQLNIRDEIELILHGRETPSIIYGKGVEFEHVLESQLQPFTL